MDRTFHAPEVHGLREGWLDMGIDTLASKIATDMPLNVVNGEGLGVNKTSK